MNSSPNTCIPFPISKGVFQNQNRTLSVNLVLHSDLNLKMRLETETLNEINRKHVKTYRFHPDMTHWTITLSIKLNFDSH